MEYMKNGQCKGAIDEFNLAIEFDSEDDVLYAMRAEALHNWGDHYLDAIKSYEIAIQKNPKPSYFDAMARSHLANGDLESAMRAVSAAIDGGSNDPHCYELRGSLHLGNKNYVPALADFNKAIENKDRADSPQCVPYFYEKRSAAYLEQGELDNALSDINEAIRLAPGEGQFYATRAAIYAEKGELDAAKQDLAQAKAKGIVL